LKTRAKNLAKNIGIILAVGIAYYIFFRLTRIGIKCPFNQITGFLCPGCGLSRMILALIDFNIPLAIYYNAAAFFLLPFWVAVFISYCYEYIKYGKVKMHAWYKIILAASVIVLVIFGIARNLTDLGLHYSNNADFEFSYIITNWRFV
jgi:hypothetical protein